MALTQTNEDRAEIIRDLNPWLVSAKFARPPEKKTAKCVESKEDLRNNLNALFEALDVISEVISPFGYLT
jgi:hypothetical protein